MKLDEIKELIDLMTEKGLVEFELERSDVKIRLKRGSVNAAPQVSFQGLPPPMYPAPPMLAPGHLEPPPQHGSAAERTEDLHLIKAPIVGTFYDAPSPGAPPFANPGARVEAGQVLCIIEAMKLMNEIESDVAGEVIKRYVENAQPVEYGESLFAIRPSKKK